jgi:hypothetical protein
MAGLSLAMAGCAKEEPVDPNNPEIKPGTKKQIEPNGSVVPAELKRR